MSTYIKNILNTKGWQEIEKMWIDEISACTNLEDLPKDSTDDVVAREARVRGETAKHLKELLKRVKLAGKKPEHIKPKSFK